MSVLGCVLVCVCNKVKLVVLDQSLGRVSQHSYSIVSKFGREQVPIPFLSSCGTLLSVPALPLMMWPQPPVPSAMGKKH